MMTDENHPDDYIVGEKLTVASDKQLGKHAIPFNNNTTPPKKN